jgi:hypothetical protein
MIAKMNDPDSIKNQRAKAIAHLEVALTMTNEIKAATAGAMIEMALYNLRADERPDKLDFLHAR